MSCISERYPWDRLDDLILFGMMFLLIALVSWSGHWDLVSNLSSGLLGAVTMYIRADKAHGRAPIMVDLPITGSTTTTTTEEKTGTEATK